MRNLEGRTTLGRGSKVVIRSGYVVKESSLWEPSYMARHDQVFVRVLSVTELGGSRASFKMPRLQDSLSSASLISGFRTLRDRLWVNLLLSPWEDPKLHEDLWREALTTRLCKVRNTPQVKKLVAQLELVGPACAIHGDPTLANLLYDPENRTYSWCDPLVRSFIPPNKAVDVGKGFQSCWGYELMLRGEITKLELFRPLARELCRETDVPFEVAYDWSLVHLIRALPYQRAQDVRPIEEVLDSAGL